MAKYRSNASIDKFTTVVDSSPFLCFLIFQGKFLLKPSVFVTAEHHHSGLKRDAASVWVEDVNKSSFKVCLRELENYAGSHEDLSVVSHAQLS